MVELAVFFQEIEFNNLLLYFLVIILLFQLKNKKKLRKTNQKLNYKVFKISKQNEKLKEQQEKLPIVFNTFQKIENQKNMYRSFGLGLTLVKHLTLQINTSLRVKSTINVGTKFCVHLPIKEILNQQQKQLKMFFCILE